jgi:gamma-glutamyltranspeptidase/glutathione hydrolase
MWRSKPWLILFCLAILASLLMHSTPALAQSPVLWCNSTSPAPAWCSAVRGDRPSAWQPQGRSEVMSRNGIVATSQPLAAQAGLRILMQGGNAIDAAVATAATLNLVEPMNVGLAGDLFAIIYIAKENKLYQLNASGMAPAVATAKFYNDLGYVWNGTDWDYDGVPSTGILSTTVPGSIWGWDEVVKRFGKLSLLEDFQPAIDYAEDGFPVSEIIGSRASGWSVPNAINCLATHRCTARDPDAVAVWMPFVNPTTLAPKGPMGGQIFKNPELAHTLRLLGEHGRNVFYKGEIAHAIADKAAALSADSGGTPFITLQDLANYKGEWVTPAHTTYTTNGVTYDLFETKPPSQAWNTLELMNILEACVPIWSNGQTLKSLGPTSPLYWHMIVEAKKIAYEDLYAYNGDPNFVNVPLDTLLSKDYAKSLCPLANGSSATPTKPGGHIPGNPGSAYLPTAQPSLTEKEGDTIYLTTADRWGNMVSWVNSNYSSFGSGVGIRGYGFVLHDRGAQFTLQPGSPNLIAPHHRPFNTISAGFVMQNGEPLMTLGLMGGDMQVQGHAQMLVNILDLGANLQASTDMARFVHNEVPDTLNLETQLYPVVGAALKAMGHKVSSGASVGGYQAIMFTPDPTAADSSGHDGGRDCDDNGGWRFWGDRDKDQLPGAKGKPLNGFYRAGSDHRKDGGAVGW